MRLLYAARIVCGSDVSHSQRGGAVAANAAGFRTTYSPDGTNTVTFEHEVEFKDNGFLVRAPYLAFPPLHQPIAQVTPPGMTFALL